MQDAIASYATLAMAILLVSCLLTTGALLRRARSLTHDRDTTHGFNVYLQRELETTRATLIRAEARIDALDADLEHARSEVERNHYLRDVAEDELHASRQ